MKRKIGYDKWKHFHVGILMGIIFQIILQFYVYLDFTTALWINMLFVNIIGFGFELFSKITGLGHAELNDALATTLGGAVSASIILLLEKLTS